MSIPALIRLREANPETYIAILSHEKLADLWRGQAYLDEVITFSTGEGVGALSKRLRTQNFDVGLVFPNSFRSAFEIWLSAIPRRIGYGGRGRTVLLTQRVPHRKQDVPMRKRTVPEIQQLASKHPDRPRESFPLSAHQMHHYLHLVGAMHANSAPIVPRIDVTPEEQEALRKKFSIPVNKRVIGLNPGAEYGPAKRWPTERFIETAAGIKNQQGTCWIVFGGPGDLKTAERIETGLRTRGNTTLLNLAGRTSLRELCTGLSLCETVLTNDTGPMHLAAAVGTRVIVPFGSTSPELTGPGLPGSSTHSILLGEAPCAPCFLRDCPIDFRCMRSIAPERAILALDRAERR